MYHLVYTTSPAYITFSLKATHHPVLGQSHQAEIAFPLCHCEGSLIHTPSGECAVEKSVVMLLRDSLT